MLLSPIAGLGAYGIVQLFSQLAALAVGTVVMLAFALTNPKKGAPHAQ